MEGEVYEFVRDGLTTWMLLPRIWAFLLATNTRLTEKILMAIMSLAIADGPQESSSLGTEGAIIS